MTNRNRGASRIIIAGGEPQGNSGPEGSGLARITNGHHATGRIMALFGSSYLHAAKGQQANEKRTYLKAVSQVQLL